MEGLWCIVVFAFLFVSIDVSVSQSTRGSSTSKKDCPESRGYKWMSCLMVELSCNPKSCARYRNTDLIKNITCKKNTTPCGTCVPKFYLNEREINCDTVELTGYDCPPGVRKVNCTLNPCESTTCRDDRFLVADCKPNYCGGCFAEYFVDNRWQKCPVSVLDIQPDALIVQTGPRGSASRQSSAAERAFAAAPRARRPTVVDAPVCPNGQTAFECPASVCQNARCLAYPTAKCRIDNCGGCRPQWTHNIYVIKDCNSRECPSNTLEMVCNDDPCKYSTCVKHAHLNPVCRPSRCGGCKAQWFVNDKEVDCFEQYGLDVPCPNGETRRRCPSNTCKFKKCPKDKTITCTVDNCGGCFPEYRNMNNEKVKCDGWWTPYESRRVRRLQGSASAAGGSAAAGRSGGTDVRRRNDLRDVPLLRTDINRVAPVAPVAPVRPVVRQGGNTPSVSNESVRNSAQRGLESVLGAAARRETTRTSMSENAIDKNMNNKNDGLLSKDFLPVDPVPVSPTDPSGLLVDMPPPPPADTPITDGIGGFGIDAFSGPTGPQSNVDSPTLDGPGGIGLDTFGGPVGGNQASDPTLVDTGFGIDTFGGTPTDVPLVDSFGANTFGASTFGNSGDAAQTRDVPIVDSAPGFGVDSFSGSQLGATGVDAQGFEKTAFSQGDRISSRQDKNLRASALRADILSKRAPPKVVKDMRKPPPKRSKPLKTTIDSRTDLKITPAQISNTDPPRIDRTIAKQGGGRSPNVKTDPQDKQSVIILIQDNMGPKNMQPSLLDWLLRGLMDGGDFTGVPIQAMGQQPV